MPLNLSIKNVPDELVERLRRRAKKHHCSLQGELMAFLWPSWRRPFLPSDSPWKRLTARYVRWASRLRTKRPCWCGKIAMPTKVA